MLRKIAPGALARLVLATSLYPFIAYAAEESPATPAASPAPSPAVAAPAAAVVPTEKPPLKLEEVLAGVERQYPPFLAALIEQDIVNGRARSARGSFDTTLSVSVTDQTNGYYDGEYGRAVLEQPLSFWGGSVYGGYRLSSGYLPNYNKERTASGGQVIAGIKLPLLRDGTIDARRVKLKQALIDEQLADPYILRQRLDFVRAATIAYYNWVAMGRRMLLAEELLRIAKDRQSAIGELIAHGSTPPIVRVDNERLVISRNLALVQARRRFEAAAIELSLFHRSADDAQPVVVTRDRLPKEFPVVAAYDEKQLPGDTARAVAARPEMRRYQLTLEKAKLDGELADNDLLPELSVGAEAAQAVDGKHLKDVEATEIAAKVELKIPLERREAKGRLQAIRAQIRRLELEAGFARERIENDVRDSHSALRAATGQIEGAERNVELAEELRKAENERFNLGAVDLLALQIREQAAFEAQVQEVESRAEYFRAFANYRAATAADAPEKSVRPGENDFVPKNGK
jgi:outer membrane protein TolC